MGIRPSTVPTQLRGKHVSSKIVDVISAWYVPRSYLEDNRCTVQFRHRHSEAHLTLKGRNIPFVDHVKYLGIIFDKNITWRLNLELTEAKAFRTFIRIYSLFKSERLSSSIYLTHHKTVIRSVITYAWPGWELGTSTKQSSPHHCKFSKTHTCPRFASGFQTSAYAQLYKKLRRRQAKVIQNRENRHIPDMRQGEARHRKYKRLKLGGGQAYVRSRD
jgi:hypothetical protein